MRFTARVAYNEHLWGDHIGPSLDISVYTEVITQSRLKSLAEKELNFFLLFIPLDSITNLFGHCRTRKNGNQEVQHIGRRLPGDGDRGAQDGAPQSGQTVEIRRGLLLRHHRAHHHR